MKKILLLLLCMLGILLSGCDNFIEYQTPSYSWPEQQQIPLTRPQWSDFFQPSVTETTELATQRPAEPPLEQTQPATRNPIPEFSDLVSLRDYMNTCRRNGQLEFSFYYTGSEELMPRTIAQMTAAAFVDVTNGGNRYSVILYEYPGDRIVDAWFSGNTDLLTADEKLAMQQAEQILNASISASDDMWELEKNIHDALCDRITYRNADVDFTDYRDMPRELSVIGALLDGHANCQGYADAFYTVASMAGFTVDRINVETPGTLHCANLIQLDGSWYLVDVDDDDHDSDGLTEYHAFNAGLDRIYQCWWPERNEIHPVSKVSSPVHYYYLREGISYTSIEEMVDSFVQAYQRGERTMRGMVCDVTDGTPMNDLLYDAMNRTGVAFEYRYHYFSNTNDTFYTVVFYQ